MYIGWMEWRRRIMPTGPTDHTTYVHVYFTRRSKKVPTNHHAALVRKVGDNRGETSKHKFDPNDKATLNFPWNVAGMAGTDNGFLWKAGDNSYAISLRGLGEEYDHIFVCRRPCKVWRYVAAERFIEEVTEIHAKSKPEPTVSL